MISLMRTLNPSRHMSQKEFISLLLGAGFFTLFHSARHVGFILIFTGIPVLIWVLFSLGILYKSQWRDRGRLIKICVWITALVVSIGAHLLLHHVTRNNANEVVAAVEKFAKEQGRYPKTIDEVGITKPQLADKLGNMARYRVNDAGQPILIYMVTFIVFDSYQYDFQKAAWRYRSS